MKFEKYTRFLKTDLQCVSVSLVGFFPRELAAEVRGLSIASVVRAGREEGGFRGWR